MTGADENPGAEAAYVEYWLRRGAPPKTFAVFRLLFKRFPGQWVPTEAPEEQLSIYAAHGNIDSERFYFENMFPFYDDQRTAQLLLSPRFKLAQEAEARSRIYRNIHKQDLFDHLMPAESRAYWKGTERVAKIFLCMGLAIFAYIAVMAAPSLLYGTLLPIDALTQTYHGPQADLARDGAFGTRVFKEFSGKVSIGLLDPTARPVIQWFFDIHDYANQLVENGTVNLDTLSSVASWTRSTMPQKKEATTFALFYQLLKIDRSALNSFINRSLIVITPENNRLEIVTQLIIVICTGGLLTLFFSRKIELFEVLMDCAPLYRAPAPVFA
ncbi:MAG TPA: hypothetical protein VKP66_14595 [Steroidobacteraceae bacterium]|nr:hypothetical protein [Steroidobacteraceae bacterium]